MNATTSLKIRTATGGDEEFVVDLARRLADFTLPPWRAPEDVVAAEVRGLLAAFANGRHRDDVLIAEDAIDARLGFVYLERVVDYFTQRPHGHVSMLAVAKTAEGRGVATALMNAAERWAFGLGFPYLTLNVFQLNARARALYERLGYEPDTVKYLKPLRSS